MLSSKHSGLERLASSMLRNWWHYLRLTRRLCFRCCVFVSPSVSSQLGTKTFQMDWNKIFREGWQWANKQMITFSWRSASRIHIVTLVRHALAEVCTVPVLLVLTNVSFKQCTDDAVTMSLLKCRQLHFIVHFPGQPGLADSPSLFFLHYVRLFCRELLPN